jgi:glycosyltransferase involved in cell wall biosynthesis
VKLSVVIATRNRASHIRPCLDSVAAAIARADHPNAEIVIVDNASTDKTREAIEAWAGRSSVPIQSLAEPRPGKARALNCAVRASRGELLAFTDDDCRLHPEYINDLFRHEAADTGLVLRGGRIELGDPSDLPFTIDIEPNVLRWSLAANSARHHNIAGKIAGCNMTMRRELVEKIGLFDEDFGPGSLVGSGEDTDYVYRAYLGGAILEHVPDMTVFHYHGRKTSERAARVLNRLGADEKHPTVAEPICATLTVVVTPPSTTTSCDQSNW